MKTLIQKDTCTPVFIAAVFIIGKIWKQPKCLSTINGYIYIHHGILISYKKDEILPFAAT